MAIKKTILFLILFSLGAPSVICEQIGKIAPAADYIKQGNACYDKKEYSKAVSLYEKAANEDPKNILAAIAHYKCAKTLEVMGKHDKAISECSKSIAINPLMGKGIAYLLRAFIYEKTKKYIEAASDYSNALIVNPEYKEAGIHRQRLFAGIYTRFTNEGFADLTKGLAAKDNASAKKYLDKASSLFAAAMNFNIGDKTAFAMANFTKGLIFRMISNQTLGAIKSASSNREAKPQLVSAYYTLAVTNAYYKKALTLLKNEKLKNWLKQLKTVNDKEMDMVRPRIDGLESWSDKYTKAADLEAACIVNFDAVSYAISIGDREGASRVLDENDSMVSDLRRLKSANAEGISCLSNGYAELNTIFSYPLADRSWIKKNKANLDKKIDDCINNLGRAKSTLVTKELGNLCSRDLKTVSALKDMFKKIDEKELL